MPFSLNAATSEISFLPNTLGHFVVSLAVDEFRNGVKIGEIRRDMQIIVLGSSNSPRLFNFTSNIAPVQNRQITVNSNTTLHLAVSVIDPVDNDLISINAAGRAFLLNNPPVFTTYPVTSGYTNADLTWTPTNNEASNTPYVTSFRIGENHAGVTFYRDETFLLAVNRSVGIEDGNDDELPVRTWDWYEKRNQGGRTASAPVSLAEHLADVESHTRRYAEKLPLNEYQKKALILAAKFILPAERQTQSPR